MAYTALFAFGDSLSDAGAMTGSSTEAWAPYLLITRGISATG